MRTAIGMIHVHNVYVIGKEFCENAEKRAANAATARKTLRILRQQLEGHRRDLHVVVGDFNFHHPLWSKAQQARTGDEDAEDLICWMADNNLQLLTKRGMPTHESGNTIDFTWASGSWQNAVRRVSTKNALYSAGIITLLLWTSMSVGIRHLLSIGGSGRKRTGRRVTSLKALSQQWHSFSSVN